MIAIYIRVSTKGQNTASQRVDIDRWLSSQPEGIESAEWQDDFTGTSMKRPAWKDLEGRIEAGEIDTLVIWRLDRLGRTASGLVKLFDLLQEQRVNLISLKDGVDLSTPTGRLIAHVMASIAEYETEIRGERVSAGIAAAKASGKTWGGRVKGVRYKVTDKQIDEIKDLREKGLSYSKIAACVKLSRSSVATVCTAES